MLRFPLWGGIKPMAILVLGLFLPPSSPWWFPHPQQASCIRVPTAGAEITPGATPPAPESVRTVPFLNIVRMNSGRVCRTHNCLFRCFSAGRRLFGGTGKQGGLSRCTYRCLFSSQGNTEDPLLHIPGGKEHRAESFLCSQKVREVRWGRQATTLEHAECRGGQN